MSAPARIGKYEIRGQLGMGAMGAVYQGFDPVIERLVAIKTILAEYLEHVEYASALARFKREAQAGGRLQHPGIVGIYEYGEDERMAFIVMEYVAGKELRRLMRERPGLPLIDVFEVMKQLLAALDYAHRNGVVHRDIKPSNVMVQDAMKIKVMDFGVARIENASLTQTGTVLGTPTHIAPEQLAGQTADGRADLWGAGVILYELLTGETPFAADTPVSVMYKVMHVDPVPPSTIVPTLPAAFDSVLARALEKDPAKRFQNARDFANSLVSAFLAARSAPTRDGSGSTTQQDAPGGPASAPPVRRATPPPTPPASAALTLAPETLEQVEVLLSRCIGPLARHLVRTSLAQARSVREFFSLLAANVPAGGERAAFVRQLAQIEKLAATRPAAPPATTPPATAPALFDASQLALAEKRLAEYVGPLARVLIKRAANDSGDINELYRNLAKHIDSERERAAFLKGLA
ncbi:MAG TPA: serine/threonine-protein kinase [Accumulibacter sp.]|uniref:serine/threonine-protein kinase n=3 Tax=Accumulibacter sp. TaxID=2053492 RepID=UPI002879A25D|nr:serine/threonine-protein kinase [Accumulibacter sp.]MDS4054707.1 serine/threonine-protein kinase [Accumulibacter sp.]HMV05293.1 serine/threonine-protein kinase [Accumulibacter sp.]HMW64620.1 serine/threonine-protein kinase [Accumulibacter sp.]HMW81913.1 serine/threonine-protein kinase [Accumulibacter sp.]HNC26607.1 serine/threonine-protein kinase [Accumulibacter sp.]